MQCSHHADMDNLRDQHRAAHRAWVQSGGNGVAIVLIGSATTNDQAISIGNFGILKADSETNAYAFAEGDPFNGAGIVSKINITRLPDGFQEHRITEPMTNLTK